MLRVHLLPFQPRCTSCELVHARSYLEYCTARDSHSIGCVQIGGSNNSITAANSLMGEARVQKRRIMQSRPAGNCCPEAISFNIGQASIGITRVERYGLPLISLPFLFEIQSSTDTHTHTHTVCSICDGKDGVINDPSHNYFLAGMMGGVFYCLPSYSSSTSTPLSCLHKSRTEHRALEERGMAVEIHGPCTRRLRCQ